MDSGFPLLDASLCDCLAPIQTSYFSGPYNLHYLLIQGIGVLLCHHPFCFPSESQTLFGIGAGRPSLCQWNLGSGFQLLLGFPDFLSSILDSKAQDSGFHNPDSLTWGEFSKSKRYRCDNTAILIPSFGRRFSRSKRTHLA